MKPLAVEALGVCVHVESDDGDLLDALRPLFSTYAPSSKPPELHYRISGAGPGTLFRNGEPVGSRPSPLDLSAVLELDFFRQVIDRARFDWLIHGAALATPKGLVVLAGPSGAGKTTLALALLERGLRYVTDETVAVDTGACGRAEGLCRPIPVSRETVLPSLPFRRVPYPVDPASDSPLAAISLLQLPPKAIERGAQPVDCIIAIRHEPREHGRYERLSGGQALTRLWPNTLGVSVPPRQIGDYLASIPTYALTTRTVGEALQHVDEILDR